MYCHAEQYEMEVEAEAGRDYILTVGQLPIGNKLTQQR